MKRIPSLDGFRAISIAVVILGHLLNGRRNRFELHAFGWNFLDGGLGVFIFFVISGYLITTLLLREYDKNGSISLKRFYFRRFFRIVPPLYAYILFVVLIGPLAGLRAEPKEVLVALTFTRNLDFHAHQFMFEHFWSLCIEEQFYLLWPLALLLALHWKGRKGATRLAIALIILAPIFRVATYPLIHSQPFRHFIDGLLPGHMDALMFGCWASLAEKTPKFELLYKRVTRFVWFLPIWFFGVSEYLTIRIGNEYSLSIGQTLDGIAVVFMILWATRNADSIAGRILNWRPVVHIGVISYSIYIWQTWFLHPANHTVVAQLPWNLLCILAAAEFSWHVIERASRWMRDRWEPVLFASSRQLVPARQGTTAIPE